jgi:hypothetical protein
LKNSLFFARFIEKREDFPEFFEADGASARRPSDRRAKQQELRLTKIQERFIFYERNT